MLRCDRSWRRYSTDTLTASAWWHAQPLSLPQTIYPFMIHPKSITVQFSMSQTVTTPPSAPGELVQALHQNCLVGSIAPAIAGRRARQTGQAASLTLRALMTLNQMLNRRFLLGSAYQFFELSSLRQSISKSRSANNFFMRAFSFSSSRRR